MNIKPITVAIEVDVRPSRRVIALIGSMESLVLFLIALAFVLHGCYAANDPNLPSCDRNPEACGGYPSAPSFMHKRDGGQ